jgi:hypothetical protein
MISERDLIAMIERLEADALRRWVELGWITPARSSISCTMRDVRSAPLFR